MVRHRDIVERARCRQADLLHPVSTPELPRLQQHPSWRAERATLAADNELEAVRFAVLVAAVPIERARVALVQRFLGHDCSLIHDRE